MAEYNVVFITNQNRKMKNKEPLTTTRRQKAQTELMPVLEVDNQGQLKLSEVSKPMRKLIRERAKQENDAIIARFKQELKNPAATEASVRATLTPTANSTINTSIQFNNRTILKRSLSKSLRVAHDEAEADMKTALTLQYQQDFEARPVHTPTQLKQLDDLCRKAKKPLTGKF